MSDKSSDSKFFKTYYALVIAAALGACAFFMVLSLYGTDNHLGIKSPANAAAWGQFGDFVGGVLNPIFGFLSFLALLYTIGQQRVQFSAAQEQIRRDLLLNRIEARTQRVREFVRRDTKDKHGVVLETLDREPTLKDILQALAFAPQQRSKPYLRKGWEFRDYRIYSFRAAYEGVIRELDDEASPIIPLLRQWKLAHGEPELIADITPEFEKIFLMLEMFSHSDRRDTIDDIFPDFKSKVQQKISDAQVNKGKAEGFAIAQEEEEERKELERQRMVNGDTDL